ncbi:branched-chain amino acid ABC transporter permease [Microbacterium sp. BWT-B31]|uniref:branched-chain amino acid ABC transporter permease n=1 Tax=Microbacterium sp. BWT-B31 TaxID=3232072 RepID=UPI003528CCB8
MNILNALVQGILLGGLFAMSALGLSLAYGVLRIVNLAHGQLMILAAYLAVVNMAAFGADVWLAMVIVIPIMFMLGFAAQYFLFQRALRMSELAPLVIAFGLSVIIPNALISLFTTNKQLIASGSLSVASVQLGGMSIGVLPLLTMAVAIALIVGLQLFLNGTSLGRKMRAASDDPDTLRLMGVNYRTVYASAMGIAFVLAGLAGVFLGIRQGGVTPIDGQIAVLFAFETVIIGGLGSLWGTLLGGIVLGVAQTVAGQINPELPLLVGNLVFLAVLVIRPSGILKGKVFA